MKKNVKLFCVVCRAEIPLNRLMKHPAVTCGDKACVRELKRRRRAHQEEKKCLFCGTPSTPQERREFKAWRAARGDHKKRGRKPRNPYPVEDPRQLVIPNEITVH